MNVPTEKLKIIDLIIALQDASTIEKLKFLKNSIKMLVRVANFFTVINKFLRIILAKPYY